MVGSVSILGTIEDSALIKPMDVTALLGGL